MLIQFSKTLTATIMVLSSVHGQILQREPLRLRGLSVSRKTTPSSIPLTRIDLKTAGKFAVLSKSGVTQAGVSNVQGDIGTSPIAHTALTGFDLVTHSSTTYGTSHMVNGHLHAADYTNPTDNMMTVAVFDMEAAFVDAAGRPNPDFVELGAGLIDGMTLCPGLYKWSTGINFYNSLTFEGSATDIWILQVSGIITAGSGSNVVLKGGAKAENIFWQSTAAVFGTTSHLEGVFLCLTAITFATGSSLNGAVLAQTAVTLDSVTIVKKSICDTSNNCFVAKVTDSPSRSPSGSPSNFPSTSINPSASPSESPSFSQVPSTMPSNVDSCVSTCLEVGATGRPVDKNDGDFKTILATFLSPPSSYKYPYGNKINCWDVSNGELLSLLFEAYINCFKKNKFND